MFYQLRKELDKFDDVQMLLFLKIVNFFNQPIIHK
jgi:hypothetical protein